MMVSGTKLHYDEQLVFLHDVFNIISLGVLLLYLGMYCLQVMGWGDIQIFGSRKDPIDLFDEFLLLFVLYLVVDTFAIAFFPSCVITSPGSLTLHHLFLLPICLVLFVYPRYSWYFMVGMTSELNTFCLVLRRLLRKNRRAYAVCNWFFYFTWIFLRLVMFPWLTFLSFREYLYFSMETSSPLNLIIFPPLLMVGLSVLSYKWTFDLLSKNA